MTGSISPIAEAEMCQGEVASSASEDLGAIPRSDIY
jgi:hypothetical protein